MKKSKVRLPEHTRPQKYQITLKPDLESFLFEGKETIFLVIDKTTSEIILHAKDLKVSNVHYRGKGVGLRAKRIVFDKKSETVSFKFLKPLPKGAGELSLEFKGILNNQMRGFYKSSYMHKGEQKHLVTTQFESTDARRAFPCFDEPAQKAVFDVTLIVQKNLTPISNTLPVAVAEHEGGFKAVSFASTPKMSTYLLAFIAGDFEFIEGRTKRGVQVRIFVTPGKKPQAKFALTCAIKSLDFYEKYFAINYPLPILDMIAIPDFSAGAMENWGAVTYRESALLLDEAQSSASSKQWIASVIAHELAHQWFGNLVTMKWWTHLWLNEGFASYISYLAVDHMFPQWDMWTQFAIHDFNPALQLDSLKNTHAIEVEVHHPSEISEIFDQISYDKGASIIRMLASYLGETAFRDGLRHYLKKHAYSNAKTEDLWAAFEKISKKPVKKMMQNWTQKPGYPVVRVIEKIKTLDLQQSRFFSSEISRKASKDKILWSVPLSYFSDKEKKLKKIVLNNQVSGLAKSKNLEWIKFNAGQTTLVRVDYPSQLLLALRKPIKNKQLPVLDRLGILGDALALAESGQLPTAEVLALAESFKNEQEYTIWVKLASGLDKISDSLVQKDFRVTYNEFALQIFLPIAKKMGWSVPKTENHTSSLLRSLVLYHAGHYGDKATIQKAQSLFKNYINQGKAIHPDIRGVVYNLVAENGGKLEHTHLINLYRSSKMQEEKDRIARSLGRFRQAELLLKTLAFAFSKNVKSQDTPFVVASVTFNLNGAGLAWKFIQKNWQVISKRYAGGGHLLPRFISPLASFNQKNQALSIKKFFQKHKALGATRSIEQVLESIYSNSAWASRDSEKLKNWLKKAQ